MDTELLTSLLGMELSFELIVFVCQILVIIYLAIFVKAYIEKLIAWHSFKRNLYLGLNTKVTVVLDEQIEFTGYIVRANKNRITVHCDDREVIIDTRAFMTKDIIIYHPPRNRVQAEHNQNNSDILS